MTVLDMGAVSAPVPGYKRFIPLALAVIYYGAAAAVCLLFGIFVTAAIKPLDCLFRGRKGTMDAAASTYFFGRKAERAITDKELIGLYRS